MARQTGNQQDMPEDPDEAMAWLENLAENPTLPRPARKRSGSGQSQTLLLIGLGVAAIVVFVLLVINLLNFL
jgi:hypothetical protein